jgi:MFS family permease
MLFLAGLGSLAGVLVSGRIADRLDRRGWPNARIVLPAACYLAAAAIFVPTLLLSMIVAAVPLLVLAGGVLAAANPPLDAARLDIVPAPLWGRAEGVRTLLRQSAQTAAPLLFGLLADTFSGTAGSVRPSGAVSPAAARGLQDAFLLMLIPLALNGLALLGARRSYPADASRASAST